MASPAPPFGALIASRPVLTGATPVSPNACAFQIPSQPAFSHIAVFVLPGQSLPDGTAALVFIQIPPSTEFKLLGGIGNEKQSAIFKVNVGKAGQTGGESANLSKDDVMIDDSTSTPDQASANNAPPIVLGISVESTANAQKQLEQLKSTSIPSQMDPQQSVTGLELMTQPRSEVPKASIQVLAQRIIENAFNFLSSFAEGSSGKEVVPLKSFQDWWEKFKKRLELDPNFLEQNPSSPNSGS